MERSSNIVGICIARLHESASSLIQSLCSDLKAAGMRSLVFQGFSDFQDHDDFDIGERALFRFIPYHKLSALILFTETIKDASLLEAIVQQAKMHDTPVITVENAMDGCFCLAYDTLTPLSHIVEHIFEHHGCKRVAFMSGFQNHAISDARLDVYRKALERHGIPYDESLVQYGEFWEDPTVKALDALFRSNQGKPPIEAIICANDAMAMTVVLELKKMNIHVPDDILVTGFDGIVSERFFSPRLTTAFCDNATISGALVDLILQLQSQPDLQPYTITIPYQPVIAQSCGCHPVENPDASKMLIDLSRELNSLRFFHRQVHNGTILLLDEQRAPEQLEDAVRSTNWGICWYQTSLVLFRNTLEGLGLYPEQVECGKNAYEFCRWTNEAFTPSKQPFSSKELLPDLELAFQHAPSQAILVTALHVQSTVLGYFVIGFEPPGDSYQHHTLDYGRLLDYQMSLAHSLNTLIQRRSLLAINAELERLYVRDPMTGLFNRRGFFQRLNYYLSQSTAGSHLFIAAIDMDGLKYINDTFGHSEGDLAIIALSDLITNLAPPNSAVARFGGDEFMIAAVLSQDELVHAQSFPMRMAQGVDEINRKSEKPYCIAASCGIEWTLYTDETDIDAMIRSADDKLYVDKARHKCLRKSRRKP